MGTHNVKDMNEPILTTMGLFKSLSLSLSIKPLLLVGLLHGTDVNTCLGNTWTAIDMISVIWKSHLFAIKYFYVFSHGCQCLLLTAPGYEAKFVPVYS